jgi:cell wall-associated NlpC family hydrolase
MTSDEQTTEAREKKLKVASSGDAAAGQAAPKEQPKPAPTDPGATPPTTPAPMTPAESDAKRADLVKEYLSWGGTPYGHGEQEKGVEGDCSGSMKQTYESVGLPITPGKGTSGAQQIANSPDMVQVTSPKAGDIAYWPKTANGPNHVAMYSGETTTYKGKETPLIITAHKPGVDFPGKAEPMAAFRSDAPTWYRHKTLGD